MAATLGHAEQLDLANRTLFLSADAGHATVLEVRGNHCDRAIVEDRTFSAKLPADRDILSDHRGRAF